MDSRSELTRTHCPASRGGSGPTGRSSPRTTIARWSALAVLVWMALLSVSVAEETPEERQERIAAMSPAEKEELRQRYERFCRMKAEQQQRLRQLHTQLEQDPSGSQLKRVMHGYTTWLERLPTHQREELRQLEPAERIKRIKALLAEEARYPSPEDREGLQRWLGELADENEQRVLQGLPESERKEIEGMPQPMRRMRVFFSMARQWSTSDPEENPVLDEDKLATLRSYLSEETRKRMEQRPVDEQRQMVGGWIRGMFSPRMGHWRGRGGPSPQAQEERIAYFFEHGLSEQQRARLLAMPPEEMEQELRDLYLQQLRRPGWRPGGRGPGGRGPGPDSRGPEGRGPDGRGPDRGPPGPPDRESRPDGPSP